MRPAFLYWMAASLLIGIAWAAMLPRANGQLRGNRFLSIALAGLTFALLSVGVVSHTLIRHVVQVTPPVVALMLVARRPSLGTAAAIPLLTFWLGLMILIWLFLLDVVRLISGHFTTPEIALTIVIAMTSGLGLLSVARSRSSIGMASRVGTALLFACFQAGALVLSMQPWAIFR
jgi:hypothetical protein